MTLFLPEWLKPFTLITMAQIIPKPELSYSEFKPLKRFVGYIDYHNPRLKSWVMVLSFFDGMAITIYISHDCYYLKISILYPFQKLLCK